MIDIDPPPALFAAGDQCRYRKGVLVAVSIPIFTAQLEKSRDAVSIANIRAAYAEAASSYLTATKDGKVDGTNVTVKVPTTTDDGTATVTGVLLKGQQTGWSDLDSQLSFGHDAMSADIGGAAGEYTAVFTFSHENGACTLTSLTKSGS